MKNSHPVRASWWLLGILGVLLTSTSGCVGLVAHLIHTGWGDKIPARYEGFEEKKVAVVCLARSSLYGPSSSCEHIATNVEEILSKRVEKITMVRQQQVNDWIDQNGWDRTDYVQLGKGIGADFVIAVDILSMSMHEGNTLFRGRSTVQVRVFDAVGGKVVYREMLPELIYPSVGGTPITDVSEPEFRRRYLDFVTAKVAQRFFDYDRREDFAQDPTFMGF